MNDAEFSTNPEVVDENKLAEAVLAVVEEIMDEENERNTNSDWKERLKTGAIFFLIYSVSTATLLPKVREFVELFSDNIIHGIAVSIVTSGILFVGSGAIAFGNQIGVENGRMRLLEEVQSRILDEFTSLGGKDSQE